MASSDSSPLIFYKHITPYWLKENAMLGFNADSAEVTESAFKVPTDTRQYESLFQMELLSRRVLRNDDDIVVKVKAGVEYPSTSRRNPMAMIFTLWCPGDEGAMSIQINNPQNYRTKGPFQGVEAEANPRGLRSVDADAIQGRPTQTWYYYNNRFSEMYEFTYCPNSPGGPWASTYCAVDNGAFSTFAPYFNNLKLNRGLNLGIYRTEPDEEYIIKSLEISIYKNSPDANGK